MQSANPDTICIWRGRTLFLGSLPQSQLHRHSAAAACVGLDGPFRVQEQGVWRECLSALIPQNVEHNLDSDGPCAVLFMDPESTGYSRLSESNACNDSCVINFKEAEDLRSVFSSVFRGDVSAALLEEIDRITFRSRELHPFPHDARLRRVIEYLLDQSLETNPAVEELCAVSNLSESRLQHLFKETLGISIRKFRTWFRLKAAAILLKEDLSITDAAIGAGFYDAAHFAHCFRDTFGFAPSSIFRGRPVRWYIGDEAETRRMLKLVPEKH